MPRTTNREPIIGDSPEIFKKFLGSERNRSIVINASSVGPNSNFKGRRILVQGTLLKKVGGLGPGGSPQYVAYDGSGTIEGVLGLTQEFLTDDQVGASPQDRPAVLYFGDCEFDARAIVNYSSYGTAAKTALPTCFFVV